MEQHGLETPTDKGASEILALLIIADTLLSRQARKEG